MSKHKSYAQRIAIQKAQERAASGDQHYNHAWRSLDTADARLAAVERSHNERPVCGWLDKQLFEERLSSARWEICLMLDYVKKAADAQRKKEGRK